MTRFVRGRGGLRGHRRRLALGVAVVAVLAVPGLAVGLTGANVPASATFSVLEGADASAAKASSARRTLALGMQFSVTRPSSVTELRFLKAPGDVESHRLTLWDSTGRALASVRTTQESASGWQRARLDEPVALTVGTRYTASYTTRRYMASPRFFATGRVVGPVVVHSRAGVFGGSWAMPRSSHRSTYNYWVDVVVQSTPEPPTATTTEPTTTTTQPTVTTTTSTTTTSSTTTTTTTAAPAPTTTTTSGRQGELQLPRVPWEGGSAYFGKFPAAKAAGWSDPSFFPIAVFYGKPEHAPSLRALGVNTYMGAEHDGSRISSMTNAGIDVIAQSSEWTSAEVGSDQNVVGWFISDECDMGYSCSGTTDEANLASQRQMVSAARAKADGRFTQANFGNGVLGTWWAKNTMSDLVASVDVSSVDKYAYTSPHVQGLLPQSPRWKAGAAVGTSAAYGWLADQLRSFGSTSSPRPAWVFVETARPYLDEAGSKVIKPAQIEGAVWSAIIHEARGIAYFQHSNDPTCSGYSLIDCDKARQDAVRNVDAQVAALAPVINTQSYVWNFGSGTDTMLKVHQGDAYVFAGVGLGQSTGTKTFTLPPGVNGTTVTVVDENRTIPVVDGKFSDAFAAESSHHVYRVSLG